MSSNIGDIDGDGRADYALGANARNGEAGGVYVVYGSALATDAPLDLDGTVDDDTLMGAGAADRIRGLRGEDMIQGLGGADTLRGGHGGDTVDGGAGDDRLNGGPGADRLIGGAGRAAVTGRICAAVPAIFEPGAVKLVRAPPLSCSAPVRASRQSGRPA
jgi:Ca2+-binding RTX toxin-like protein